MNQHPLHKLKNSTEIPDLWQPSDDVWKGIRPHLPGKKKNRLIWIWIFILVGAGTGFWSLSQNEGYMSGESNSPSTSLDKSSDHPKPAQSASSAVNASKIPTDARKDQINRQAGRVLSMNFNGKFSGPGMVAAAAKNRIKSLQKSSQIPIDDDILNISDAKNFDFNASINPIMSTFKSESLTITSETGGGADNRDKDEVQFLPQPQSKALDVPKHSPAITGISVIKKPLPFHATRFWLGLGFSSSLAGDSKNLVTANPLGELVQGSYYQSAQRWSFNVLIPVASRWAIKLRPSYVRESLITDYDLNIPYDFNSEKKFGSYNENYFQHSLPTDQGNIITNLVVSRSSDSPVGHNELISIDFRSQQKLSYLSVPIGISFGNTLASKTWFASFAVVPEFLIARTMEVDFIHSNHTFVAPKTVAMTEEKRTGSLHTGLSLETGYRIPLYNQWSLQMHIGYTHYLNQSGRTHLWAAQCTIGKSF